MGRGGDGYCHPHPLLSYTYPAHTQREREIESHPRPQWVRVFPPHPRPHSESIFLIKKEFFYDSIVIL